MSNRKTYPRPQFVRKEWTNLNGQWQFAFDDNNEGLQKKWYNPSHKLGLNIEVPFVYQCKQSGINQQEEHPVVWYQKSFKLKKEEGQQTLLHFGAVDYFCEVFINGQKVGSHNGGHTSFSFNITPYLISNKEEQTLTVRVEDSYSDEEIPRGKQSWTGGSHGIWYTNSTGIWQTVWLENVTDNHIASLQFTPMLDEGMVKIDFSLSRASLNHSLSYSITFKGEEVCRGEIVFTKNEQKLQITADVIKNQIFNSNFHGEHKSRYWTPEHPNLFDVQFQLKKNNEVVDQVTSYFGLRKIHTEGGKVYLNNHPYYQKLVLDQGYWPEGLLTAPSDEDFKTDIELAKAMGFNGCRKHQKTEDPLFLYWADKLGYLVWGECASTIAYSTKAVSRLTQEWLEIVERDYNHPCLVAWVPLNESWGVPSIHNNKQQQSFAQSLYHLLHSLDTTRLVVGNDGWAMTETDICAIHNYQHGNPSELEKFEHFKKSLYNTEGLLGNPSTPWPIFAQGHSYKGQPILLTEFGGIGYRKDSTEGWGYTSVKTEEEFISEYQRIMGAVLNSVALCGFCYTQLTDVEQEINGLLTYDRKPKTELQKFIAPKVL